MKYPLIQHTHLQSLNPFRHVDSGQVFCCVLTSARGAFCLLAVCVKEKRGIETLEKHWDKRKDEIVTISDSER